MYNRVQLLGRLGKEPELKYSQTENPICRLSLATSEVFKKDGQKVEQTEWHNLVCFGKTAENCANYLHKGSKVFVEGSIHYEVWEKDGQKRNQTQIKVRSMQFVDPKVNSPTSTSNGQAPAEESEQLVDVDQLPF